MNDRLIKKSAHSFLPISPEELAGRGTQSADVLLISGDAYVDHPSFGVAIVGRLLESFGLTVAIVAQPDWYNPEALAAYGRPRLFIGITAGNMDSMVNHFTAHKKRRHNDAYSPDGKHGSRPNRATIVYAQLARQAFSDSLIIIGGIEASLRRYAHYDYWSDGLRRSILLDSRADLLVYGMAERPLRTIVDRLMPLLPHVDRQAATRLWGIRGTGFVLGKREATARGVSFNDGDSIHFGSPGWSEDNISLPTDGLFRDVPASAASWTMRLLPAYDRMTQEPKLLAQATRLVEQTANPAHNIACIQQHGESWVIINPPAWPLTEVEFDAVHELPYARTAHPQYHKPIPAAEMICNSIQITRGCFGGCSFCAIGLHEGKWVQSRSQASILHEVAKLQLSPRYRGIISDLGGPTANMWRMGCKNPSNAARCRRPSCLHPRPCPLLQTDHGPLRQLMRAVREAPGVRQVFIASGIRHDLALRDPHYIDELVRYHLSGHLHLAPEHMDPEVLRLARKPSYEVFEQFVKSFNRARQAAGLQRYLNPYFVSGLPGSTDSTMKLLARKLCSEGWRPQQVQSFIPTPGTIATAMYYAGINPYHPDEHIPMPRTLAEKIKQHALLMTK
jgi:uncharacterized radical SAM protein YgiQ